MFLNKFQHIFLNRNRVPKAYFSTLLFNINKLNEKKKKISDKSYESMQQLNKTRDEKKVLGMG